MNLRIYPPDGRVRVSAPIHYSERLIKEQIQEKIAWIQSQRRRIQERADSKEELLHTGATIPFLGSHYLFILEEHQGPAQITMNDQLMHGYIQPNASQMQKQALLDRWYKQKMESLLPDLITHWEQIIKVKVSQWGIRKMRTRWGSCNTRSGRICLNLNLIKKPIACLEYVLVHELVHLLEASHNQRFYRLMSQFMPQWREYQYLLEGKYSRK